VVPIDIPTPGAGSVGGSGDGSLTTTGGEAGGKAGDGSLTTTGGGSLASTGTDVLLPAAAVTTALLATGTTAVLWRRRRADMGMRWA
jgi:hypothetical protein